MLGLEQSDFRWLENARDDFIEDPHLSDQRSTPILNFSDMICLSTQYMRQFRSVTA
jgi:hypothetical protein